MNPHEFDLVEGRRARLCDQGLLVCRLQASVSYFKIRELFILHNIHGPTLSEVQGCGEPHELSRYNWTNRERKSAGSDVCFNQDCVLGLAPALHVTLNKRRRTNTEREQLTILYVNLHTCTQGQIVDRLIRKLDELKCWRRDRRVETENATESSVTGRDAPAQNILTQEIQWLSGSCHNASKDPRENPLDFFARWQEWLP